MSAAAPTEEPRNELEQLRTALATVLVQSKRLPNADPPWHMFVCDHETWTTWADLIDPPAAPTEESDDR